MNRRSFLLALAPGALLLGGAVPAWGQDALAAAKAAGHVGERPDGLAGVVPGATPSMQALVDQVNAQRLERYRQIARSNGTSVEAVQAVAGQELIARTPAGQHVFSGGRWVRK